MQMSDSTIVYYYNVSLDVHTLGIFVLSWKINFVLQENSLYELMENLTTVFQIRFVTSVNIFLTILPLLLDSIYE